MCGTGLPENDVHSGGINTPDCFVGYKVQPDAPECIEIGTYILSRCSFPSNYFSGKSAGKPLPIVFGTINNFMCPAFILILALILAKNRSSWQTVGIIRGVMSELNFRIILVPKQEVNSHQKESLIRQVKSAIEASGLSAVAVHHSQVKKSEEEDYPEIEEFTVDVRGRTRSPHIQKVQQYERFCLQWKTNSYSLPFCAYIALYGNDSFVKYEISHHVIEYKSLAFGTLPHNGKFYRYADLETPRGSVVDFYHDTRNAVIRYERQFELTFSYENIRNIFINIESNLSKIYFDLFNPPIIFRIEGRYELRHRNLNLTNPSDNLLDLLDFLIHGEEYENEPKIDVDVLGRSNVLSLSFDNPEIIRQIISGIHYHCSEKAVYYSSISEEIKSKPADPVVENMHFGCTYLITALFKRNFVLVSQASDIYANLRRVLTLSKTNPEALEKALTSLLSALDSGKIIDFWHAIESQYVYYTSNQDEINFKDYIVPSKCSMIRRITLTPTRQLLWPKEIMFSNRVLRNFNSDYSVRVSFREDNMSRLSFNAAYADEGVLDACIRIPMTNGIRIGLRKYEFLAWSNSQIRDHGVWMYAKDEKGKTAAHIRAWMGDFSHIRNVPKYMARMGQCFSQTEDALSVPLDQRHVRTEADVEGGYDASNRKPYCFSDGVGKISSELAAQVHKALGHDKLCSAFQIRYGGCKGMLVTDPTLKDAQIVFRKSMVKFVCPNSDRLEIARTSAPVSLHLNRQFITLLNGLGVRHRVFLRLQEDMLKTITDMLFEEHEAAKFLRSKTPASLYNYEDLSASGIFLTTEPFFKSLLLALHRHHIENIKIRANVSIDPSQGRNMLGVMDETGSLDYGEVFVQYTKDVSYGETTRDTVIYEGDVLVTKNPCLHPGDVRKFKAKNIPALRHIVDCIVFPRKGRRPHPNEMAGSDLDGDEYAVLWNPDLFFHCYNKEPANFPAMQSPDVPSISVRHMISFLQEYIKSDQVGPIANAHLAHADNGGYPPLPDKEGIFSDICRKIANKFSIAVDFAKNGHPQRLEKHERPTQYPDFMENARRDMYKSKNALGKMYRVCKDFESENLVTSITYENITVDPDLMYPGWERYKRGAEEARNKYNGLFRSMLRNYGVQHEAEALSGAFTHLHCRFQERKDRNEIEKVIIGCIKKLNSSMQDEFMEEFLNAADIAATHTAMLQKASAWYIVTYSDPDAKFLSFAWTVSKHLVNIKLKRTLANRLPFSPKIMSLDEKILECESRLPHYVETGIWNDYLFLCDQSLFKRALRTLVLWAQEEEIVERPGQHEGLLYMDVFVKLFFHVSEKVGYVARRYSAASTTQKQNYSAAHLCLEFLKFCSTFRFYNPHEMRDLLPFFVFKHSKIGKRAIVSYHSFALSGTFKTLEFDKSIEQELIRMKSFHIDSKIFSGSPIPTSSLKRAEEVLIKYSKVEELNLRELLQTKKVCVSGRGTEEAIKELKSILRKKHVFLRQLFQSGVMPDTK